MFLRNKKADLQFILNSCKTILSEPIQKKPSPVCRYNGQIYILGQTFTALDKCNQCGCKEKGNIVCTKTACPDTTTPGNTEICLRYRMH